ncbi:hypothetical protein NPIL_690471 [Nephila pilipes]|uniref:Uncharacterized protein n=1 Tax=Nephila pilipes TaxID=299642 RepID=A0A8X6QXA2_NEPPI|nr:hypothetical protein NPIL_690471 [Nephila pilipes]
MASLDTEKNMEVSKILSRILLSPCITVDSPVASAKKSASRKPRAPPQSSSQTQTGRTLWSPAQPNRQAQPSTCDYSIPPTSSFMDTPPCPLLNWNVRLTCPWRILI